jgi:hypothetical protein
MKVKQISIELSILILVASINFLFLNYFSLRPLDRISQVSFLAFIHLVLIVNNIIFLMLIIFARSLSIRYFRIEFLFLLNLGVLLGILCGFYIQLLNGTPYPIGGPINDVYNISEFARSGSIGGWSTWLTIFQNNIFYPPGFAFALSMIGHQFEIQPIYAYKYLIALSIFLIPLITYVFYRIYFNIIYSSTIIIIFLLYLNDFYRVYSTFLIPIQLILIFYFFKIFFQSEFNFLNTFKLYLVVITFALSVFVYSGWIYFEIFGIIVFLIYNLFLPDKKAFRFQFKFFICLLPLIFLFAPPFFRTYLKQGDFSLLNVLKDNFFYDATFQTPFQNILFVYSIDTDMSYSGIGNPISSFFTLLITFLFVYFIFKNVYESHFVRFLVIMLIGVVFFRLILIINVNYSGYVNLWPRTLLLVDFLTLSIFLFGLISSLNKVLFSSDNFKYFVLTTLCLSIFLIKFLDSNLNSYFPNLQYTDHQKLYLSDQAKLTNNSYAFLIQFTCSDSVKPYWCYK